MIIALIIFLITYVLMLSFQQYRPWIALSSAAIFIILGYAGLFDLNLPSALAAVDYNVLLMIAKRDGDPHLAARDLDVNHANLLTIAMGGRGWRVRS